MDEMNPPSQVIHFDVDPEVCKLRVMKRKDHPTIPYGSVLLWCRRLLMILSTGHGAGIVQDTFKAMEPPSTAEGFQRIFTVTSAEDANRLDLVCPPGD